MLPQLNAMRPFYAGRRVLVTGGAGFIGSHLARTMADLGAKVSVIDDLSTGSSDNLAGAPIDLFAGSILDDSLLASAIAGCAVVFHEAAMVSVPLSVEQPEQCRKVNIEGTHRVLLAARDAGVKRVVFAASAAAYGDTPTLPSSERHAPDCRSPYAASKVAGEQLLRAFAHSYGLSTASLRYFNVFGPRQSPNSGYAAAISAFFSALSRGARPIIFGDGLQTRDFIPVANIVLANLLAAASPRELRGEIFNIGTGHRTTLLTVLEVMSQLMGVKADPVFAPPRAGDVRDSVADISLARDMLAYEPVVGFEEGLQHLVAPAAAGAAR
ncbi:MAG: NAD-dependent epimerase/dehydratase family protein [Phycisphaeraceae bacterium]|nr:NAD-dependent epimerase/dehydratase family protein [Phycisphaeraceae bacterium]